MVCFDRSPPKNALVYLTGQPLPDDLPLVRLRLEAGRMYSIRRALP